MKLLIVTAVEREAGPFRDIPGAFVEVGGVGRTNAALAVARAERVHGTFDAVLSMGIAGALPDSDLSIGDVVVATRSVYVEEGIVTPNGFADLGSMGFQLGPFEGNAVPGDPGLIERFGGPFSAGVVATVATCSGTDRAAREVVNRTGAVAEAMEGASVLHAAATFGTPGLEIRVISNTTGNREQQEWDLDTAFARLAGLAPRVGALVGDRS